MIEWSPNTRRIVDFRIFFNLEAVETFVNFPLFSCWKKNSNFFWHFLDGIRRLHLALVHVESLCSGLIISSDCHESVFLWKNWPKCRIFIVINEEMKKKLNKMEKLSYSKRITCSGALVFESWWTMKSFSKEITNRRIIELIFRNNAIDSTRHAPVNDSFHVECEISFSIGIETLLKMKQKIALNECWLLGWLFSINLYTCGLYIVRYTLI